MTNPFGSSMWSTDENGHETLTQKPNERTQGAIDRAFAASETPFQQMNVPPGMSQLAEAILGRVGARYGLGSANPNNPYLGIPTPNYAGSSGTPFNTDLTSAKGQQQTPPQPQIQPMHAQRPMVGMPQQPPMGGG